MKKWLNLYFGISKREFNGLLVLIALIGIITAIPYLYAALSNEPGEQRSDLLMIEKLKKQLRAAEKIEKTARSGRYAGTDFHRKRTAGHKTELFRFDPNLIGGADWQRLGLSEKQAAAILKYRSKGGRFKSKEDLQKMYTISPVMYQKIEPFIHIRPSFAPYKDFKNPEPVKFSAREKKINVIEINAADSAGLCEIKGIGPVFAMRIIRYRQRLGGFCKAAQLLEVYGLDSLKYAEINQQIAIDHSRIKTININTAEFDDLKQHPYLRYKQVNALIQYRKQHGNYSNIADLNKVLVLNAETIARIAPYLVF